MTKLLFQEIKKRVVRGRFTNKPKSSFNIVKDGVFEPLTESGFITAKRTWERFCKLSYHNHQNPPTEEMFLDYFKKKKEDGIKSDNMFQQFRYLRKVYLYLFSHEFESNKVEEYMKMVSDGSDNQSDPGICPHCGEVSYFSNQNLVKVLSGGRWSLQVIETCRIGTLINI